MPVSLIISRRLLTIKWVIRQYNVNIQCFEHDMVSIRSMWQGRHGAWLIDTPPQMTDSPQHYSAVITYRGHLFQSSYYCALLGNVFSDHNLPINCSSSSTPANVLPITVKLVVNWPMKSFTEIKLTNEGTSYSNLQPESVADLKARVRTSHGTSNDQHVSAPRQRMIFLYA